MGTLQQQDGVARQGCSASAQWACKPKVHSCWAANARQLARGMYWRSRGLITFRANQRGPFGGRFRPWCRYTDRPWLKQLQKAVPELAKGGWCTAAPRCMAFAAQLQRASGSRCKLQPFSSRRSGPMAQTRRRLSTATPPALPLLSGLPSFFFAALNCVLLQTRLRRSTATPSLSSLKRERTSTWPG